MGLPSRGLSELIRGPQGWIYGIFIPIVLALAALLGGWGLTGQTPGHALALNLSAQMVGVFLTVCVVERLARLVQLSYKEHARDLHVAAHYLTQASRLTYVWLGGDPHMPAESFFAMLDDPRAGKSALAEGTQRFARRLALQAGEQRQELKETGIDHPEALLKALQALEAMDRVLDAPERLAEALRESMRGLFAVLGRPVPSKGLPGEEPGLEPDPAAQEARLRLDREHAEKAG